MKCFTTQWLSVSTNVNSSPARYVISYIICHTLLTILGRYRDAYGLWDLN